MSRHTFCVCALDKQNYSLFHVHFLTLEPNQLTAEMTNQMQCFFFQQLIIVLIDTQKTPGGNVM